MKVSHGTVDINIMQQRLAVLADDMRLGRVSAIAIVAITQKEGSETAYSEEHWILTAPDAPARHAENMQHVIQQGIAKGQA